MQGFRHEQVMSGTWGELWIDGEYFAEVLSFKANVKLDKQEINKARTLAKGYKIVGITCTGSMKLHKVSSTLLQRISANLKLGKATVMTIIAKVDDPDSIGAERVVIKDATFDEINLADWEVKKILEENLPFTFSDWDILDVA